MGFNQPSTLELPAGSKTAITLFRQATYPLWADYFTSYALVTYHNTSYQQQTVPGTFPVPRSISGWVCGTQSTTGGGSVPGVTAAVGDSAFTEPLFAADRGMPGSEWLYFPGNNSVVANAFAGFVFTRNAAHTAAHSIRVEVEVWSSPGESYTVMTGYGAITAGDWGSTYMSVAWALPSTGCWFRPVNIQISNNATEYLTGWTLTTVVTLGGTAPTYVPTTSSASAIALGTLPGAVAHMPLVVPVEFKNSPLPWYATRTTAAAVLGTNVSQVLNKGGTILAGRVSPAVKNAWQVASDYIAALHPAEKSFLPLETGVYTYAPPSTDLIEFHDYTLNTSAGAEMAALFLLSNDSMYNKLFITPTAVSEVLAVTASWHIEFRTSSALFPVALSSLTLETLHQAQLVLAESGFFFENPEHDGLLNKVIRTAKRLIPEVVTTVNPVAGRILKSFAGSVKPKQGKTTMPPTTAAASGIAPKAKPQPKPKQRAGGKHKKGK